MDLISAVDILDKMIKEESEYGIQKSAWGLIKDHLKKTDPGKKFYIGCANSDCGWSTRKGECGLVRCCPGRK